MNNLPPPTLKQLLIDEICLKIDDKCREINELKLQIEESSSRILDIIFLGISEQIDLAETRIKEGESLAVVFRDLHSAMAILRG